MILSILSSEARLEVVGEQEKACDQLVDAGVHLRVGSRTPVETVWAVRVGSRTPVETVWAVIQGGDRVNDHLFEPAGGDPGGGSGRHSCFSPVDVPAALVWTAPIPTEAASTA